MDVYNSIGAMSFPLFDGAGLKKPIKSEQLLMFDWKSHLV